jgi:hypothetical protein
VHCITPNADKRAIGGAAIGLLNNVICADLISTQWRGVMFGVLSTVGRGTHIIEALTDCSQ